MKEIDWESLERQLFESTGRKLDEMRARGIRIEADTIVSMILRQDIPRVDVDIAIRKFREKVLGEFPGKGELFDGLYMSRFERIWQQFREKAE
jgi:hypothetical protein